jgi:hypothetical protein
MTIASTSTGTHGWTTDPGSRIALSPGLLVATVIAVSLAVVWPVSAQEAEDAPAPEVVGSSGPAVESDEDAEGGADDIDPCTSPDVVGQSWVDWINRTMQRSVCGSAMWFDSFFGDERASAEYGRAGGRASAHVVWQEHDGFDPRLRFRVNFPLPNLSERADAFVGRETKDEYLTDVADRSDPGGPLSGFADDEDLLLGLGYSPRRGGGKRFRLSGGVKVDAPPEPYVKFRYYHRHEFSERSQLRLGQTVFWELEDRFGTTTNLDLERRLAEPLLLRWANTGTISEITNGVEWWSNLTLFQRVDHLRALAYTLWITGETDAPVDLSEYGARIVVRRRVYREWLFVDFGPIVSWPREELHEEREMSWGATVGVEMLFGTWSK